MMYMHTDSLLKLCACQSLDAALKWQVVTSTGALKLSLGGEILKECGSINTVGSN